MREKAGTPKKPHIKPQIRKVRLKAEEAILGNCKTTAHRGPGSSNCQIPVPCSVKGS